MLSHDPVTDQDGISQAGECSTKTLPLKFFLTNEPPINRLVINQPKYSLIIWGNIRYFSKRLEKYFQGSSPFPKEVVEQV